MAITKPSDLFDFDAWHKELERLESRKEKYSQSVIQSNERIQKSYNENLAKLKELDALMRATGTQKAGSTSAIGNMGKEVDKLIAQLVAYQGHLKAVSDSEKINGLAIEQLTKSLKALETEYKRLDPTSDSFANDQQRIAGQVKQVTSAINAQSQTLKVAKKTVDEAGNSYNKLSRQTADMKTQLRNLDGAFNLNTGALNKNNAAGVMLAKQIEINDDALKRMDATMGNHQRNVGNYSDSMRQLGLSLRGALTTFFGVTSAFEAISQSLLIIDEFKRLKLGLDAVSDSSQQVSARFSFISTLADKTGQDISKLSGSYISFAAAARNTTLEGKSGDAIFKSFSNSFSALGKSSEVAERGLYAVQQMMSKGKVSSEELNQQLAEALPGANKLFADAMKLSTAELAHQMKKGKILATDVLPKVAAMLEEIYGDRAQSNVTTISGSFTRFTNQIKLFLDDLNKDSAISGFLAGINNGFADLLKRMRGVDDSMADLGAQINKVASTEKNLAPLLKRYDELKEKGELSTTENKELFKIIQDIDRLLPGSASGFDRWGNALDINRGKVSSLMDKLRELLGVQREATLMEQGVKQGETQKRIDQIRSDLQTGTAAGQVGTRDLGMGVRQPIMGRVPTSPQQQLQLRKELNKLEHESVTFAKEFVKYGGAQVVNAEVDANKKLAQQRKTLNENLEAAIKRRDDLMATKVYTTALSDEIKNINELTKSIKANEVAIVAQNQKVATLKSSYNKGRTGGVDPMEPKKKIGGNSADDASTSGSKSSKSKFDQLSEDIDKVAKQIEDELLADFNAGRELAPSDAVIEKWNKLYQQIVAVSVATGNSIPSDLSKLNDKLQGNPVDLADQIVLEKVDTPDKEKVAKDPSIPIIGEGLAILLEGHEKELKDFYRELNEGSFKGFTDKNKQVLIDQLLKIQKLQQEVNLAVTDIEREEAKKRLRIAEDELSRKKDIAKTELEDKKKLYAALSDLAQEAGTAVFAIAGQQLQADLEANEQKMNHELSLVKGNEEAQNRIRQEYSKKDLQLRQKQARLDKAEAAFKIAINTAVAISSVSPVVPLMIIAAALGAIQLAVVLSKPIPQFFKGTKNAPAGLAQVGEKGPEIRESKGKMYLYEDPTVAMLEKGDKIYTAEETRQMMESSKRASEVNAITNMTDVGAQNRAEIIKYQVILMKGNNGPAIDYNKMRASFVTAMESQPVSDIIFDENGVARFIRNKNSRVMSFNNRYSLG